VARETIQVSGLREFQKALRDMDRDLPKQLRIALNSASELVINYAKPKVPKRSGRAAGSLKVRSSQKQARIAAGGARAPYYPFLDFGGSVGPGKSVHRPFYTEGRYIYPGLKANKDKITQQLEVALTELAKSAGLEVD
jgi:hypothetical protein